jgi:hypothetical protein
MRLLTLMLTVSLAVPLCADEPKKSDWTKIRSDDGKLEVQFPEKPTKKDGKGGTQYLLETMGGKSVYLVMSNSFPQKVDPTNKDFVKTVFEGAVSGLEKSLKGEKVSDKESKFAGKYPARDVDLKVAGIGIYRTKWIMTETAFIQLVVAGAKEFVDGPDAKKFFEALKIKD